MTRSQIFRVIDGGAAIEVQLAGRAHRFHALWLRDNAQDSDTRSADNGQRLITLIDIPIETRILSAEWFEERLRLHFEPEGKVVDFDVDWLAAHSYDTAPASEKGWTNPPVTLWDSSFANAGVLENFDEIRTHAAVRLRWLKSIAQYGFARLAGVPTSDGAPAAIVALFGYVRETNYGRIFDIRAEVDPTNLAFTNLGLQPHTDNPYRDPVPGIQVLACLQNDVEGGESIVVDGFAIAARLRAESPRRFALLSQYNARFEYHGARGVRLCAKIPLIELGPDGELLAVRFNNRSAAPFTDIPYDDMADYYRAYRRMAELAEDPTLAVRFKLAPGEAFVVDNTRVLHARSAITGSGNRHLQGCYADKDGLLSSIAVLEHQGVLA